MNFIFLITGILLVFFIAFLVSNDRKKIKYKRILIMLAVQIILVYFMMNTSIGLIAITRVGKFFEKLLAIADTGIQFVFGGMVNEGANIVFLCSVITSCFHVGFNRNTKLHKSITIRYQILRFNVK